MKTVYIYRGLPGSGKNKHISENFSKDITVCSADDYFTFAGVYRFDPSMIGEAHNACMRKFLQAINANERFIVVNNTNINAWEISPYVAVANAMGYQVEIQEVQASVSDCISRNIHKVPAEVIGMMYESIRREILPSHWIIKKI